MLRGIAVGLVCLCHAGLPFLPGGFIGVDVFFVLSGYLISGLLVREYTEHGSISYGAFIARRLRRLLPALAVMILLVLAVSSLVLAGFEFRSQTGAAAYAAIWASNLFFALRELDYFNALESDDLFLHTWSLGVEEQFYLLWPLLIGIAMALVARRNGSVDAQRRGLIVCLFVLAASSLVLSAVWTVTQPLWSFYMMPARVWQFAAGGLVFLWEPRFATLVVRPGLQKSVGALGIAMILGSAIGLDASIVYPGGWALIPTLGTALVLLAFAPRESEPASYGSLQTILAWFGDRSYSIYLWHWPVLILSAAFVTQATALNTGLALLVTVALGSVSYRYIELPFWKGRFSHSSHRRVAVASFSAIGAVSAVALSAAVVSPPATNGQIWAADYDPRNDAPPIYVAGMRCDTGHLDDALEPCALGASDAPHTAVLFGDSIGAQWVSMLPAIYQQPDWQIVVLTKSACPIVDEDYVYERIGGVYSVCANWRQAALEHIANLAPDVVFVGSDAYYPFDDEQWVAGSRRIMNRLSEFAANVVIIPGTPKLGFDGPSCLEEPDRFVRRSEASGPACAVRSADRVVAKVGGLLRTVADQFTNVHELALLDLVCPDGYCAAGSAQGGVVFRDDKHVTDSFVVSRVPELTGRLDALGVGPQG